MDVEKTNDLFMQLNACNDCPPWAVLLFSLLKEIMIEVKSIVALNSRVTELESSYVAINERVTTELQLENQRLHNRISELNDRVDDQEQRSRNGCLLIHGVEEGDEHDTDTLALNVINNDLGVQINLDDIQRSHRVGPKKVKPMTRASKAYPRPIIVRFLSWRKRNEVFRAKRKLKGSKVAVTENLTRSRYELLKAATAKIGRGNVWSSDGRVTTKIGNVYHVITCHDDIAKLVV